MQNGASKGKISVSVACLTALSPELQQDFAVFDNRFVVTLRTAQTPAELLGLRLTHDGRERGGLNSKFDWIAQRAKPVHTASDVQAILQNACSGS